MSTLSFPRSIPRVDRPERWWRRLCWVAGRRIAISGDLPASDRAKRRQLQRWVEAGITHIVDVRGEHSDEAFVAVHAPGITYVWLGTHDNGGAQDRAWFDAGVAAILEALSRSGTKVVVHCHMGVNRAPSLVFGALLARGVDPLDALDEIRTARPIAAIGYSEDAIEWWCGTDPAQVYDVEDALDLVRSWHDDHTCDVGWIISRIRLAGRDDV